MSKLPERPERAPASKREPERVTLRLKCAARKTAADKACSEVLVATYDEAGGVWRGVCKVHQDVAVCPGGLLESLKVK